MIEKALAFVTTWWKVGLAVLAACSLCFMLGECDGRKVGRGQMQHAIDQANLKAQQLQHRADELTAQQRLTDTIAVSRQEEALRNAVASTPDSAPDAARIALGCQRLLAAGSRAADLPAACRADR